MRWSSWHRSMRSLRFDEWLAMDRSIFTSLVSTAKMATSRITDTRSIVSTPVSELLRFYTSSKPIRGTRSHLLIDRIVKTRIGDLRRSECWRNPAEGAQTPDERVLRWKDLRVRFRRSEQHNHRFLSISNQSDSYQFCVVHMWTCFHSFAARIKTIAVIKAIRINGAITDPSVEFPVHLRLATRRMDISRWDQQPRLLNLLRFPLNNLT